jgi:hypothetical protein
MTLFSYNLDIPAGTDNPSADRPFMTENTNSTAGIIAVDHFGFEVNNGGYHTIIHQPIQSTDPANIPGPPGFGQTYVRLPRFGSGTDGQLCFRSPNGGISQLTGDNSSLTGWQAIGGVLLQWGINSTPTSGSFSSGKAAGTTSFSIPFPHGCFVVIPTPFWTGTRPSSTNAASATINSASISSSSPTPSFSWDFSTNNSGSYTGFYWIAIGN